MADKEQEHDAGRRNFLKVAATAVPAAAAVAVTGDPVEAATVETKSSGLRDTPHVQAYLDSARF